jgi:anti-anti-sigma regulatory factor
MAWFMLSRENQKALGGVMLNLATERIGELAIVECQGRIVRSEAAYRLRQVIMSLRDALIVVLDLSEVGAIEGGGLGMLLFLQRWAYDRGIQLKLFNPTRAVRDRLERAGPIPAFDFPSLHEMMALLANADGGFALAA